MEFMKIFMSIDIEGVNGICNWEETEASSPRYKEFQEELQREVKAACRGAIKAGATEIVIKDAHDSARNLNIFDLPEEVKLHRGWEGNPCSMMAGLDDSFDAVIFIGYHSPSRSNGNPLSHTMNTHLHHIKINGVIASEFTINAYYASTLKVPVAFLSGDANLTALVKDINPNIETVASKEGRYNAVISNHPNITCKEIETGVYQSLKKDLSSNTIFLPNHFDIEIQYKRHTDAYRNSFFPGCKLLGSDRITYQTSSYKDALVMFKFVL